LAQNFVISSLIVGTFKSVFSNLVSNCLLAYVISPVQLVTRTGSFKRSVKHVLLLLLTLLSFVVMNKFSCYSWNSKLTTLLLRWTTLILFTSQQYVSRTFSHHCFLCYFLHYFGTNIVYNK
jgi:hypothetical protein